MKTAFNSVSNRKFFIPIIISTLVPTSDICTQGKNNSMTCFNCERYSKTTKSNI